MNTQISPALDQNLTGVTYSTLRIIGPHQQSVSNQPKAIDNTITLTSGGTPEILYIGAEFCPFCAAERWAIVVALSKFGNFSNLQYMASAPGDGDIATLSFRNATYSTAYNFTIVTVENEDRNRNPLQQPTSSEQALWSQYTGNSYPFIDIGGEYILTTSQFNYRDLSNLNWTQVGSQLNNPSSSIAKDIDGAADQLIGAVCKIDGGSPSSLCSQSFALVSFEPRNTAAPLPPSLSLMLTIPRSEFCTRGTAGRGKFAFDSEESGPVSKIILTEKSEV